MNEEQQLKLTVERGTKTFGLEGGAALTRSRDVQEYQ